MLVKRAACTAPGEIEDWELEAYRDNAALPHVIAHVARCAACRGRIMEAQLLEERLRQTLSRTTCPEPTTLRAYYWDELSLLERQSVQTHVATCPSCQADLETMTTFIESTIEDSWEQVWKQVKQAAAQVHLVVARVLTPGRQPVLALRGETRQVLLFEADTVAVSVNVEQELTGGYTLFGQVLTEAPEIITSSWVRLTAPGAIARQTALDTHGTFAVEGLAAGVYQMVVVMPQQRIVIPLLTLEAG